MFWRRKNKQLKPVIDALDEILESVDSIRNELLEEMKAINEKINTIQEQYRKEIADLKVEMQRRTQYHEDMLMKFVLAGTERQKVERQEQPKKNGANLVDISKLDGSLKAMVERKLGITQEEKKKLPG